MQYNIDKYNLKNSNEIVCDKSDVCLFSGGKKEKEFGISDGILLIVATGVVLATVLFLVSKVQVAN